jgi:hypothetical protein
MLAKPEGASSIIIVIQDLGAYSFVIGAALLFKKNDSPLLDYSCYFASLKESTGLILPCVYLMGLSF